MKCPRCGSDLNKKDAVPLNRIGRIQATVCAFCSSFVALPGGTEPPQILGSCRTCGGPLEAIDPDQNLDCVPCLEGASRGGSSVDLAEDATVRILKEALRAYPPLPGSETLSYFGHVFGALAAGAGCDPSSFRVLAVADLGFKTVSVPGGTVLAGRELLSGLEDEAMLAFVLARELALQRSGIVARRYRSRRVPWALTAGLKWGLGLLSRGAVSNLNGDAEIVQEVARLGYGPEHETHADEWAINLLATTGYDPDAAVRYLKMLEARHLAERGALAAFLDVHPARSRRRCLAETLHTIHRDRVLLRKLNREVYRRAASTLGIEDRGAQVGRLAWAEPRVDG